jgi:ribosomal protein S28E/S33
MVLPAEQADVIRALAGQGGGGGGGTHVTIYAMDGADVERVLKNNPAAVAAGFKNATRRGHMS